MKYLTLILITFSVFNLYGNEKPLKTRTEEFKRVQIGINISPDICYRTLKSNDSSLIGDYSLNQRNNREILKFSATIGFNFCFNINKFLGLETGIQYSNKGYQEKFQDMIFTQPDPRAPLRFKSIYDFHYLDIPLKANFTIGKKKFRFFTSVGVTANLLIKATETSIAIYSDLTDKKTFTLKNAFNTVNISPTISAGIDYKINHLASFRIEPTFRYGVLKIIDAPLTGYLYNVGLNISYYIGL